jgi:CheY-like chemotaxis protein
MPAKVLVVEDNAINRMLIVDLLKLKGYTVQEAEDGLVGLGIAQQETFDLILMDLNLPGLDGLSATQILREAPKTQNIPIIAITARAMKGDKEKILAAGCTGYLAKPINTREFLTTVAYVLEKGQ